PAQFQDPRPPAVHCVQPAARNQQQRAHRRLLRKRKKERSEHRLPCLSTLPTEQLSKEPVSLRDRDDRDVAERPKDSRGLLLRSVQEGDVWLCVRERAL